MLTPSAISLQRMNRLLSNPVSCRVTLFPQKAMKLNQLLSAGLTALALIPFLATSASAAPPKGDRDRDRDRVPAAVIQLDSTSHQLVDAYESDLRRHKHGPPRGSERRFLDAARSLEAASHTLRSDVESRQSSRKLQGTFYSLRNAMDQVSQSSQELRLTERTRSVLWQTRTLVRQVEDQKGYLFARVENRDRHDHDHDHGRDSDRDRDQDRPRGPGGILKKLFGN